MEELALASSEDHRGVDTYGRQLTIAVILCMVGVGFTQLILSTDLTNIAKELDTDRNTLAWVITGPFIVAGVGTSIFGRLGDTKGHRQLFLLGTATYVIATIGSASAWDAGSLIAFRLLAGLGSAMTQPAAFALMLGEFHGPARNRVLGFFQMALGLLPVIGLIAGGPLIEALGWRFVFLLVLPFSVVGLAMAWRLVRPSPSIAGVPVDWWGALTLGTGVASAMFGVDRGGRHGFASTTPSLLFALGALLLFSFVIVERSVTHPMLRIDYFARRAFSTSIVTASLNTFVYFGAQVLVPIMLKFEFKKSLSEATWIVVTRPMAFVVCSLAGGMIAAAIGERRTIGIGSIATIAGTLASAHGAASHSIPWLILGLIGSGTGIGLALPAISAAVANAVDPSDIGVASGALQTCQQIATVTGIQVFLAVQGKGITPHSFAVTFLVGTAVAAGTLVTVALSRETARGVGTSN